MNPDDLFASSNISVADFLQNYWQKKLYYSFFISLVLILVLFLLVEQKRNFPIIAGVIFVFSSLPVLALEKLVGLFSKNFSGLIKSFLVNTNKTFWFSMVLGLILIAFGLSLKIWNFSLGAEKFFKKFKKEENKEKEIKEKNTGKAKKL